MIIDIILLTLLVFFIWRGASRGFLQSLIGPLAFIIAATAAFFYYQSTKNMYISLGIGLIVPFFLNFTLAFILRSFGFLGGSQTQPSLLSCLLGAILTAAWGMLLILPVLIALAFVPGSDKYTKDSITAQTVKPLVRLMLPPAPKIKTAAPSTTADASLLEGHPLQAIIQDPRMQALVQDPDIAKAVEEKNYAALLSNPKLLQMTQDPAFVQKILAAYAETQRQTIDKRP